ncbi:syntaxin-17-like isoform X1 [Maniola hyperantus]|uniref:syntaxin-17-like isoform X1 n=1 Tax=Aphantopus hyperantus TaxID=2795564 RepID=UPI0037492358
MEEDNKLPLKRVELSLTKFNEVAIPHHLDLLRQHKANIIKYEQLGQYARVRSEQTHARRVAAQLRSLLGELEALRRQVRAADVPRFDRLTERARDHTLRAIMDYLGVIERSCIALARDAEARPRGVRDSSPMSISREARGADAAASTDSVGLVAHCAEPEQIQLQIQLQVDEKELELRSREAALRGWRELQREVRALHEAWQHVQAAALASRDQTEGGRVRRVRRAGGRAAGGAGGRAAGRQGGAGRGAGGQRARLPGRRGARARAPPLRARPAAARRQEAALATTSCCGALLSVDNNRVLYPVFEKCLSMVFYTE